MATESRNDVRSRRVLLSRCIRLALALALPGTALSPVPANAARSCLGHPVTILGTSAADTINGTAGRDVIASLGGNDVVNGRGGNDIICAGAGNDTVRGGAGVDRIAGEGGSDTLAGNAGNDILVGGLAADTLDGGRGTDTCLGEYLFGCERPAPLGSVYGVTSDPPNYLFRFPLDDPAAARMVAVIEVQEPETERILGIDYSHLDDALYVVSSAERQYRLDPATGQTDQVAWSSVYDLSATTRIGVSGLGGSHGGAWPQSNGGSPVVAADHWASHCEGHRLSFLDAANDQLITEHWNTLANPDRVSTTVLPLRIDFADAGLDSGPEPAVAAYASLSGGSIATPGLYRIEFTDGTRTRIGRLPVALSSIAIVPQPTDIVADALTTSPGPGAVEMVAKVTNTGPGPAVVTVCGSWQYESAPADEDATVTAEGGASIVGPDACTFYAASFMTRVFHCRAALPLNGVLRIDVAATGLSPGLTSITIQSYNAETYDPDPENNADADSHFLD